MELQLVRREDQKGVKQDEKKGIRVTSSDNHGSYNDYARIRQYALCRCS